MLNSFIRRSNSTVVQVDAKELSNWVRGTNTRQAEILHRFDRLANKGYIELGTIIEPISKTSKLINSRVYDVSIGNKLDSFKIDLGVRAPYAKQALDTGTPPGSFGGKDDWQQLKRWVGLTFGAAGKERDRIAYLVARKINTVGSKKYREGGPKLWETFLGSFMTDLVSALDDIGEIYIR